LAVSDSYKKFINAFRTAGVTPDVYFAVKSNPSTLLIKELLKLGAGVDVSSVQELAIANSSKAKKIIVTGPAKTKDNLKEFLSNKNVKNIYIDSVEEFNRINKILKENPGLSKTSVKFGLRILPPSLVSWDKFGVPLSVAKLLINQSYKKNSLFKISALQFHISYVKSGKVFQVALKEVADWLGSFSQAICSNIKVLDIGGGFTPQTLDGEYPWNKKQISLFDIEPFKSRIENAPSLNRANFFKVSPIEEVAKDISQVFINSILPVLPNVKLNVEPGRFLASNSMHILLSVVDKKTTDSVILDGGWNMLGWEKYQYINYSPAFNLTNWNPNKEFSLLMYGNLCLPDDIWGYYLHGNTVKINDKILIPFQGAYTYTYRQEFIRGIPKVYKCR
jgi:diaminopimelate decarboxylase